MPSTPSPFAAAALAAAMLACGRAPEQRRTADASPAPTRAATGEPLHDAATDADPRRGTTLTLGPLPADAPFEGRLALEASIVSDPTSVPARYEFLVKGKRLRWDLFGDGGKGGSAGFRVYDAAQRKFFTVLHQPVIYETAEAVLLGDAGTARVYKLGPFELDPKGAVQGIPCDRVQTDDERFHYDACLASGLPTFPLSVLGKALALTVPFSPLLEARGQFPLNVVVRPRAPDSPPGRAGAASKALRPIEATLKVVSVERGRVPGEAFDLPAYPVVATTTLSPARPRR